MAHKKKKKTGRKSRGHTRRTHGHRCRTSKGRFKKC